MNARDALSNQEDSFTERKREGVSTVDIKATLVAFANCVPSGRVAYLFVGVSDDGAIVGCSNPDSLQKSISRIASQDCYPPVEVQLEVITEGGKHVVAVTVPSSRTKPHFTGGAYVRIGSESKRADEKLFKELLVSRTSKGAALLGLKDKTISIQAHGCRVDNDKPAPAEHREKAEGQVEDCDYHFVTFYLLAPMRRFSVPIECVRVSFDHEKQRPMVVLNRAGWANESN